MNGPGATSTVQPRAGALPVAIVWLCFLVTLLPYRFTDGGLRLITYVIAGGGITLGGMYFLTSSSVRRLATTVARHSLHFVVYCVLLLAGQSLIILVSHDASYMDLVWAYGYVGLGVVSFLVWAAALSHARGIETLFLVLSVAGALIALPALTVQVTGTPDFLGLSIGKVYTAKAVDFTLTSSLLHSPNRAAFVCFLGLISSLYFVVTGRHRLLALTAMLLCALAIVIFWSRSIYLATAVALGWVLVVAAPAARRLWVILGLALVAVAGVSVVLSSDILSSALFGQGFTKRDVLWSGAIEASLAKPWIGFGLGPSNQLQGILYDQTGFSTAVHNGFLSMALRGGIPAGLAYVSIMLLSIWRVLVATSWRRIERATISALIVGSIVAVVFLDYSIGGAGYGAFVMSVVLGIANAAPWSRVGVQARTLPGPLPPRDGVSAPGRV